jgi:hypothetical protein
MQLRFHTPPSSTERTDGTAAPPAAAAPPCRYWSPNSTPVVFVPPYDDNGWYSTPKRPCLDPFPPEAPFKVPPPLLALRLLRRAETHAQRPQNRAASGKRAAAAHHSFAHAIIGGGEGVGAGDAPPPSPTFPSLSLYQLSGGKGSVTPCRFWFNRPSDHNRATEQPRN